MQKMRVQSKNGPYKNNSNKFFSYIISFAMFNWLRHLVAGAKNRTVQDDYDLDLTYITPNLIAMAYPATGLQQTYRNCMSDVQNFLQQKHPDSYYVINVSGRPYNPQYFGNRVQNYDWLDHQAPPLTTLFDIVHHVNTITEQNENNVVAIHCNHGKGRTGTAIMCVMLFNDENFKSAEQVLRFYNQKRFSKKEYQVQQPCQIRYIKFFKKVIDSPDDFRRLKAFRLVAAGNQGLGKDYYLRITRVRTQKIICPQIEIENFKQTERTNNYCLMSDVFIQVMKKGILADSRIARINYNMAFMKFKQGRYKAYFQGPYLASDSSCHHSDYNITLFFQQFCHCHDESNPFCQCQEERKTEIEAWDRMIDIINKKPVYQDAIEVKLFPQSSHNFR